MLGKRAFERIHVCLHEKSFTLSNVILRTDNKKQIISLLQGSPSALPILLSRFEESLKKIVLKILVQY